MKRVQALVGLMCLALLVYFALLSRTGVALIRTGTPSALALGVGVLIMPVVGAWAMVATLRAGFAHQRLARRAAADGIELDVVELPRTPSGRVHRDTAEALVREMRDELDAHPRDWHGWYRLARALDFAGDRRGARQAMCAAVQLHDAKDAGRQSR